MKAFLYSTLLLVLTGCVSAPPLSSPSTQLPPPPAPVLAASMPQVVDDVPETDEIASGKGKIEASLLETVAPETADAAAETRIAIAARSALDAAFRFREKAGEHQKKGNLDQAIRALDNAFAALLEADFSVDPELERQKEDLRVAISRRILEIYAVRHTGVKGKNHAIPLSINEHVKRELKQFANSRFFRESYARSGRYMEFIKTELKKEGMPEELAWLPLIESGFTPHALSGARALGLWQFIPSTGYKFGLSRNDFVDERLDPEKSTRAAIAYLKKLHGIFGDWLTALAAYNCGEGRVLSTIRNRQVHYLDNFWDLYKRLPRETARYVPRFLATLHMIRNPRQYGLDQIVRETPPEFDIVPVKKQTTLNHIARATGINAKTLRRLNPELRREFLPPEKYDLRVPCGKAPAVTAALSRIPEITLPPTPAYKIAYHRVKRGDTLSTIASRYGVKAKSIMRANRMHKKHFIVAGNILKIPVRADSRAAGAIASSSRRTSRGKSVGAARRPVRVSWAVHTVARGDSLWNIARKYDTSTRAIQRLNGLKNARLSIGQRLKIPGRILVKKAVPTTKRKVYRVKNGDVPFDIAQRYNMPLEKFLRVNQLTPGSRIFPGQALYVE